MNNDVNENTGNGRQEPAPENSQGAEPDRGKPLEKQESQLKYWPYYLFLLLVIVGMGYFLYSRSPAAYRAVVLKDSAISFNAKHESGAAMLYFVTYSLESKGGQPTMTVTYNEPGAPGDVPAKKVTGTVDPKWYIAFYQYLEETGKPSTADSPDVITLRQGKNVKSLAVDNERLPALEKKFQSMEATYGKNAEYGDLLKEPEFRHVAARVDPAGNLVTTKNHTIFFNREDGELVMHRSGSDFEIGRQRILAANADGLGLFVEMRTDKGNSLVFWEKRMLQNRQYPIVAQWESEPLYRRVFVTENTSYFIAPSADGTDHSLMRYDYLTLKLHTVLPKVDGFIKDVTRDGKTVMMQTLGEGGVRLFDGISGKELSMPVQEGRDKDEEALVISGYYPGSSGFIVTDNEGVKLLNIPGKENLVSRHSGADRIFPLAISKNGAKMLLLEPKAKKYMVYDFAAKKTTVVNKTPMTMMSPTFSVDGETLYFVRFNDLFRWRPGDKTKV